MPPIPADVWPLLLAAASCGVGLAVGSALTAWLRRDRGAAAPPPTPAKPARASTRAAAPKAAAEPLPPYAADLLLVDDSAVARTKLRRLFEPAGYRVHVAHDGVEALALLQAGRYALMVTDLEMPRMDGVELIHTCLQRSQTAGMPMIAVSGHEGLRARFDECRGICGVHRKPWVDDVLLSHVATLVGLRRAPQERTVS